MAGKVYIVGGFNVCSHLFSLSLMYGLIGSEVLSNAEVYDPSVNEWTLITQMERPRSGVQLVAFDDQYLFAIGGNDGTARQTSLERYDPKTRGWTLMTDMSTPRSNFASVVLENQIYVIGGFNGTTTIADVEAYNPMTNSWQEMWRMAQHKSALSACVVSQLSNSRAYTWLRRELIDNSTQPESTRSQCSLRRPIIPTV
ncbi:unnamed protein product [Oppiella nova]|uniref:Uncharacterized protein n=1 Tax=Oppiella nova TaxID=334625 RepID=A0A7R9MEF4_9ACAR|nr:unnamed protein product [Oppiella nova]CAG2174881.1 unnamed protein product [Oppiella nova]